jgi:hypothetical protein
MAEKYSENKVVLGYHSPTEWIFFPEVTALYDHIIINQSVFDKTVRDGDRTTSIYRATKAQLLKALEQQGVLVPTQYPTGETEKEQLNQLVDYFFTRHEVAMRQLLIYAFDAFIQHEKATIEKLITTDDPHWQDVAAQLPRLENMKEALNSGSPLTEFPHQRDIAKRYFEDSILTPVAFQSGYNPVFQWEGYAKFEQFLLKFRRGESAQRESIKKGTELYVIKSLSDILLPFRVVRSPDEISTVVTKWKAFAGIRRYIAELNGQLWNTVTSVSEVAKSEQRDFVEDFNSMLNTRMNTLNHQIKEIDQEMEKERASTFSKITRFIMATLGSILPGTGGIGQVLDDAHSALIKRHVRQNYPALTAVFEYERLLSAQKPKQSKPLSISLIGKEYESVEYWDQI